jgi:hypothetical protein
MDADWNNHQKMRAGRGERIRTSGLHVPNVALYQAKLHPVLEVLHKATARAHFDFALLVVQGVRLRYSSQLHLARYAL